MARVIIHQALTKIEADGISIYYLSSTENRLSFTLVRGTNMTIQITGEIAWKNVLDLKSHTQNKLREILPDLIEKF